MSGRLPGFFPWYGSLVYSQRLFLSKSKCGFQPFFSYFSSLALCDLCIPRVGARYVMSCTFLRTSSLSCSLFLALSDRPLTDTPPPSGYRRSNSSTLPSDSCQRSCLSGRHRLLWGPPESNFAWSRCEYPIRNLFLSTLKPD